MSALIEVIVQTIFEGFVEFFGEKLFGRWLGKERKQQDDTETPEA